MDTIEDKFVALTPCALFDACLRALSLADAIELSESSCICSILIDVYVCVCVFFPFIIDVQFVGCTSRGHTGFFIHLPSTVHAFVLFFIF